MLSSSCDKLIVLLLLFVTAACSLGKQNPVQTEAVFWESAVAKTKLEVQIFPPAGSDRATEAKLPTIVYLKNLSVPRVGQEPDDSIITSLRVDGHLVIVVDYAKHPNATSPRLNEDLLKLRRDLADSNQKKFLLGQPIDVNRLYIIPEGYRIRLDIEFARDGDRVLGMDLIYPAQPLNPVPVLMEITCDNVNRMGSVSLLYCKDTLMEGAALAGFAAAMVDHPVRPPYKGIDDPMPESLDRMKAAVAKLRSLNDELPLNGKVGVMGFSRGAPFAAMLAGQGDVDAALVHGNRFDYLNLLPNDPMLLRFEKAWGTLSENRKAWEQHGAAFYLTDKAAPMYLNTSNTESAEYRDGLAKFAALLKKRGIEHEYQEDADGRGHAVTVDPARLEEIYAFFRRCLRVAQ